MLTFLILFFLVGLSCAVIMIINPVFAIEMQRRFYEKINWKIEPISMSREIRNTRFMGYLLVILLVALLFFVIPRGILLP